jgi:hypothetical protein
VTVTVDTFFAATAPPEEDPDAVPRDRWDRPLIMQPDGKMLPYHRASSFGSQIDDTYHLVLWQKRQVARGMALSPELVVRANNIGEPQNKHDKDLLNGIVEAAEEAAGSNIKSALGTAIHTATELVDRGESLDGLHPLLRNRAEAYWRFCLEHNAQMTSVETFGVEDVHRVAGTWDRTGWWYGAHKILDVKTSGSMDFAGIVFAVQLAEYAHMKAYDPRTGERTPHEQMDLEQGVIIHVGRELDEPVEAFTVDLDVGWGYAKLVDQVKAAQRYGKKAIREAQIDDIALELVQCETIEQLRETYLEYAEVATQQHRDLAARLAEWIRAAA